LHAFKNSEKNLFLYFFKMIKFLNLYNLYNFIKTMKKIIFITVN